jgi:hypothetical protein
MDYLAHLRFGGYELAGQSEMSLQQHKVMRHALVVSRRR